MRAKPRNRRPQPGQWQRMLVTCYVLDSYGGAIPAIDYLPSNVAYFVLA